MFAGVPWHAGGVAAKQKSNHSCAAMSGLYLAPPRGCSLLTKALLSLGILTLRFVFRDTQAL